MYTNNKYNHHTLIQVCILNINTIIILLYKYVYQIYIHVYEYIFEYNFEYNFECNFEYNFLYLN